MDRFGNTSASTLGSASSERPISDVLKDIVANLQDILRSEIQLARIEISDALRKLRNAGIPLAGGGVLGIYALGFLALAVMFALELVLPNWAAALIVGILLLIGAAVGISSGRALLKEVEPPRKTIQTVKENLEWIKEQPRS